MQNNISGLIRFYRNVWDEFLLLNYYYLLFSIASILQIPCRVVPKAQKMVLDIFLLNTQQYKVGIKGKSWSILGNE